MKARIFLCGLPALMLIAVTACAGSSPTASPTGLPPPPSATPVRATATLPPPSATPVPATATVPPPTLTPDPHVAGANCGDCHTEEHKRWATTLHAADPAAVLLNDAHDKEELLTDECLTCHTPYQVAGYHVGDFVQPLD